MLPVPAKIQGVTEGQLAHNIKSSQIQHADHIDFGLRVLPDYLVEAVHQDIRISTDQRLLFSKRAVRKGMREVVAEA